ncbi:MAG: sodium:solute symporter [Kiritimatiellae bacterium]|nr:sodium:solute symporter [Kiritimatiellia bacterium]
MNGIDATIIIAYLLAMIGVGVWFMRRNKSADDYFRGGGRLPWWVVSVSIYATMFSSITFLSIPALVFHSDCRYFVAAFPILFLAPLVTRCYLPFFRKLNLTSAYEYLEVRFNLGCRLFASAAFVLFMIVRAAIVVYLPAIAISAVVDMDVNTAIAAVTFVTIVYCAIGGVEAVVWSDFIQSVILILSTVAIYLFLVLRTDGGVSGFLSMGMSSGKFRIFDFDWDWAQPVFWVVFLGGALETLASYTSDQCVVQRYMTTKDEAGAAKSIYLNSVLSLVNCFVFFTLGVALWTFYQSHADKIPTLEKQDQIFPWFIANELPVGFSGIVLAAVAAATMSTLSANLNSAATAVTTDFYKRLFGGRCRCAMVREDGKILFCGKVVTIIVGLMGGVFAIVLANMDIGSIYDQFLRFLGVLTGGLASLFFMGRFMPFVRGTGAFFGLVANYVACFTLDFASMPHKPHLLLFGVCGMAICIAVASLVSIALKENQHDPR